MAYAEQAIDLLVVRVRSETEFLYGIPKDFVKINY